MSRRAAAFLTLVTLLGSCGSGDDPTLGGAGAAAAGPTTSPGPTDPAAPADAPAGSLGGFTPAPVAWEDCGDGMECASMAVPLDYDDAAGPSIELALLRIPAREPDQRIGTLLTNPGGPGATGLDFALLAPFSGEVLDRFDLVGFDPRGVGDSTGITCAADPEPLLGLDSSPDTADEQTALDAAATTLAAGCAAADGDLLAHVGTDDVARDLEAIRLALGGEPLNYVGFSYGTFIGLRYAELFPTGARAIVLDGVVDPTHALPDLLRGQTVAVEAVMADVFAACAGGDAGCPEGGAEAAYDRVAAAVETAPLPAGDEEVGPSELATAAIYATYDPNLWSSFHRALAAADEGDGAGLRSLALGYRGFGGFGSYQAVSCLDSVHPVGGAAWAVFADELAELSPRFGEHMANEMVSCAFWPVAAEPINAPVVAEGAPPIVVVGTTGDAATPVEQAERVAATLADGHLVVSEGEGHTAYLSDECVADLVDAYLIDLALPPPGARCT
ncbi:MAG: alpha/beta fold hydrolase [Acidimicrobiia bacterium]|nr:alpha/beta fold hydrolase [Acidimicrobiia bacterium]